MFIGSKFKSTRIKLNMNQSDLSKGICTQAVISKLENQNTPPSIDILIQLCQRLQLTLNDVYSEFSKLPSKNLISDKIDEMDQKIQSKDFSSITEIISSIDQDNLSGEQIAHLHFQLGKVAALNHNFDEAIFQYNYSLQVINNRTIVFWKFLSYIGLANIYESKQAHDKVAYYYQLAYKYINEIDSKQDILYFYFLEAINSLAQFYFNEKNFDKCSALIQIGLKPHNGYLSAKFTDNLYYLSASTALQNPEADKTTLSHDLTMAIAFADYNKNQFLLDKINQLMQQYNIRELKIKP
ncbi:helix-turn-helix domain-containing protein [Companilactobacillus ginsenosidimutans]|uniref:HTH cro/C1-type domain-containing protein n=1 Tax=Companilactobacillus ginsenosidimutans TaxID=1007676 RepID=A0A0H4QE12_9LACO|nr:helix-turn-helix transcriptional regulator [Companilactobacillus ginsenosidimutans]AKP66599.1 hypothetical protein ABM34_02875 [Companilactobacillus ginsenosidimutans]